MVRVVLRPSSLRCALCHDGAGRELLVACGACSTRLHAECRKGLGRCPTRGCAEGAKAGAAPPLPRWYEMGRSLLLDALSLFMVFMATLLAFAGVLALVSWM